MARLLGYLKPYSTYIALSLVFLVVYSALQVCGPLLTKIAIDRYLVPVPIAWPHRSTGISPRTTGRFDADLVDLFGSSGGRVRLGVRADVPHAIHRPARNVRPAARADDTPAALDIAFYDRNPSAGW